MLGNKNTIVINKEETFDKAIKYKELVWKMIYTLNFSKEHKAI